ncbi:MAG: cbiH [Firmicutes bacterium]|nr:cbiH [Bacillota bacterium]
MSHRAYDAISGAKVIVGYDTYLKLIEDMLAGKEVIGTGMTQEIDRCQAAVEEALAGKTVAVVSSGDPGIYGMAGLVLELVNKYPLAVQPEVVIVPGISAIGAAAAILGAPLMHDFAVISLSDLLTPWDVIEKRIEMAAAGDFVVALYNPKSTRRVIQIEKVREIMLRYRSDSTPVGIVRHAARPKQSMKLAELASFTSEHIDMFSLVVIGNSQTYVSGDRMITPRGYVI